MNEKINAQRWKNFWHTAALFSLMILIALGLGYLFLDTTGLIWAGGMSIIALFASTRMSPNLIMRLHRAQQLSYNQAPHLFQITKQLAERAQLPVIPKLYYIPNGAMNAFATGSRHNSGIAITHGLLQRLNTKELTGVLAHEISHLVHNDIPLKSLTSTMERLTRVFAFLGQILLIINLPLYMMGQETFPWLAIGLLLIAPALSTYLSLAISRTREFEADLGAARLTGDPNGLADALEKLNGFNQNILQRMFQPTRQVRIPNWLSSHPDSTQRINRLRDLAPRYTPQIRIPREWVELGFFNQPFYRI